MVLLTFCSRVILKMVFAPKQVLECKDQDHDDCAGDAGNARNNISAGKFIGNCSEATNIGCSADWLGEPEQGGNARTGALEFGLERAHDLKVFIHICLQSSVGNSGSSALGPALLP